MKGVSTWLALAKKAEWQNLQEVRQTFSTVDGVPVGTTVYTVFNIAGNHFRLIVKIEYHYQKIFIKHLLTRVEYDKGDWKK